MKIHRVAVLGASGFAGRYIVKRLAARGAVVAAGSRHAEAARFLSPMGDVGQVARVNVSIGDERLLAAFLAGNDAVVNTVGALRQRGSQSFDLLHHTGPARLARLAREAGVERFVHFSAIGADPRSRAAYARSKAAGEQAVRDSFPTATILRPSVMFGPEDEFFNRFAAMAQFLPALPVIGEATRFQPVYVGDVADAVLRCLDDPATAGRTYELGGPEVLTMRQMLERLLDEIDRRRCLVNVPFGLAAVQARLLSLLPTPPLTPDQVEMLRVDNIVAGGAMTLATLDITPTALEAILPTYLDRFRRGGWYGRRRAA